MKDRQAEISCTEAPRFSPAPDALVSGWDRDMTGVTDVLVLFHLCRDELHKDPALLELDLTSVERADSKLVACLVALWRLASGRGVAFALRPSPAVRHWIAICQVEWLLEADAL